MCYRVLNSPLSMQRTVRSSRLEVLCKKGVLKNFAKFEGKHVCLSLSFNKVTSQRCSYRTPLVATSRQCTFDFFDSISLESIRIRISIVKLPESKNSYNKKLEYKF